jgi:DNA-binding FadR family transcriptional regulator
MPSFKPIRQFRVSEEVAEQLKQSVQRGHFKSGDKLPGEQDLADEFKVSRVAIRDALRRLEIPDSSLLGRGQWVVLM